MLTPSEEYIAKYEAAYAEIIHFLRRHILAFNKDMSERFRYKTIFFYYKNKQMCYVHVAEGCVYIGFLDGFLMKEFPGLVDEGRKSVKVFKFCIHKNMNVKAFNVLLKNACEVIDKKTVCNKQG